MNLFTRLGSDSDPSIFIIIRWPGSQHGTHEESPNGKDGERVENVRDIALGKVQHGTSANHVRGHERGQHNGTSRRPGGSRHNQRPVRLTFQGILQGKGPVQNSREQPGPAEQDGGQSRTLQQG